MAVRRDMMAVSFNQGGESMKRILVLVCLLLTACSGGSLAPARPLTIGEAVQTAMPQRSTLTVADAVQAILTVSAMTPAPVMPATPITVGDLVLTALPPGSRVIGLDVIQAVQTLVPRSTPTPKP